MDLHVCYELQLHCISQPININEAMKYCHGQHDVISSTLKGNLLMYKRQMTSHYLPDKTHPKHLDNSQKNCKVNIIPGNCNDHDEK